MRKYLVVLTFLLAADQLIGAEPHYLDRYKPVAIWTLDQSPDSENLSDTSGQLKAVVHGGTPLPGYIDGARDFLSKAWDFNEVNSSLRSESKGRLQTIGDMEDTKGVSLSFWMKCPKERLQNQHRVINGAGIEVSMKHMNFGALAVGFGNYRIDFGGYRWGGPKAFDGEWHHVVATVDFSSRRNNLVMYLDGEEAHRADGVSNASFNSTNPRAVFHIGARRNGGHQFSGALDDVAVFDYPLSAEQVNAIHTGPVFAGLAQEVYLPDSAKLRGVVPEGVALSWSKKSGKGEVSFADAAKASTEATFSAPGDYVLNFRAEGFASQSLKVSVQPSCGSALG